MHTGNIRFRALIQKYKPIYRDTPKKLKPSVSTKVVAIWRAQEPPGRFLTRSDHYHGPRRTFYDVGDAAARRKAAQCLREKSSRERVESALAGKQAEAADGFENQEDSSENEANLEGLTVGEKEESLFDDASFEPLNVESAAGAYMPTTSVPNELASSNTFSPFRQLPTKEEPTALFPSLLKSMTQQAKSKFKQHQSGNEPFSLSGVLSSHQVVEEDDTDEPFSMAGIDFGDNDGEASGEGLNFPSLLGSASSSLGFPSLGGGSLDFPSLSDPAPSFFSDHVAKAETDALADIRNAVPTAASLLTINLFDD